MLSLVNYGSSDSENEITDEEDPSEVPIVKENDTKQTEQDLLKSSLSLLLPEPAKRLHTAVQLIEEDDEFLHKKALPTAAPPKKEKVKIFISKLAEFKEDEDDKKVAKLPSATNRKTGLISILPKPSTSYFPASSLTAASAAPSVASTAASARENSAAEPAKKKVGMIPYALMAHNKASALKKAQQEKNVSSDSDDDEPSTFFTFASKDDDDLPYVNEEEIKALVASKMNKKRHVEEHEIAEPTKTEEHDLQQSQYTEIDEEAMKALLGGNKAKRSKIDDIQIIDLSAEQVMPSKNEWLRRSLAGETSFIPTGNLVEKGPNALAKRKHQISYLSMRAETNEAELEAMWATNRQTKRESKSKYGF